MRKIIIYISFLVITFLSCHNIYAAPFILKGMAVGVKDSTILELSYHILSNHEQIIITDSAIVIGERFLFQGNIEGTTAARLDITNGIFINVYIEPTLMNLTVDINTPQRYQLTGTTVDTEMMEFRGQTQSHLEVMHKRLGSILDILEQYNSLNKTCASRDSIAPILYKERAIREIELIKLDSLYFDFASKHSHFKIAPDLLCNIAQGDNINISRIRVVYENFSEEIQNSMMGKLALYWIEKKEKENKIAEKVAVGNLAPNFIRESFSGEIIKLSDYHGKSYVLLDFWASSCLPCLREIPKMKEICDEYAEKELNIIGISLDENKNSWDKAVRKHGLICWPQVLGNANNSNKPTSSAENLSVLYHCYAIPFYVLIDKNGKIIAKWEHMGDKQEKELKAFLNNGKESLIR